MDIVDLVINGLSSVPANSDEYVRRPRALAEKGDAQAFPRSDEFARAAIRYASERLRLDYSEASNILRVLHQSVEVERLSLMLTSLVHRKLVIASGSPKAMPLWGHIISLYSTYLRLPQQEVQSRLSSARQHVECLWAEFAVDEDILTADDLKTFYEKVELPGLCHFPRICGDNLSVAQAALPLMFAQKAATKMAFDFGANTGLLTLAMAAMGIAKVIHIDHSRTMLDFAKWRNDQAGVANIRYMEYHRGGCFPKDLLGRCDYGICTEVLEHVADVEGAVRDIASLLRPGGLLFMSASFGHYPHPTHLRRNVRFAGQEVELMARHGLKPVEMQISIPPRGNERMFVKAEASAHRK